MGDRMKKILMACANSWTSVFQVGSHHLAREFAKMGYQVAYLSNPISPFHLLGDVRERYQIYRAGGIREDSVWAYVPATLLPPHRAPLLRSEWVHRHWHQLTFPSVLRRVEKEGFREVDILYFDTAIQSFWLEHIQADKTVFRMADQNAGFKSSTRALLKREKELIRRVDLVVCTAKTLADSVGEEAVRVAHLPNGVPLDHFAKPRGKPRELEQIPGPIALYVGAIDYWFDHATVHALALALPQVSFVLIGPVKGKEIPPLPNLHFLGPRSYAQIPQYLQCADVGLIPFDVQNYPDLIHHVNPLKLYEYMACGLPVVATRWRELENIDSPAFLCDSVEEFRENLLRALQTPNPDLYRSYAQTLDWSTRATQLLELLGISE